MLQLTTLSTACGFATAAVLFLIAPQSVHAQPAEVLRDAAGDPLPPGAVARLGSARLQHAGGVLAAEFSPDGAWLVTLGRDGDVRICEADTGKTLATLETGASAMTPIRAAGGKLLIGTAGAGQNVKLWDLAERKVICETKSADGLRSLTLSPDGKLLAGGASNHLIFIWSAADATLQREIKAHAGWVSALAFSPDSNRLTSGGQDHEAHLWDVATGKELQHFTGHGEWVWGIDFSPDGRHVATGSWDNTIGIWDTHTGKQQQTLRGHKSRVWSVAYSPDGNTLASGGDDNTLRVWDVATGVERYAAIHHPWWANHVAFSHDGRSVVSAGEDGRVRVWRSVDGGELLSRPGHVAPVKCLAVSPNGQQIVSAGDNNLVLCWDAGSVRATMGLSGGGACNAVAIAPNGKSIVFEAPVGKLMSMNDRYEGVQLIEQGHRDQVLGLSWSPLGSHLASASADGTIRLRELAVPDKTAAVLEGHAGWVTAVAFSPDGQQLASTGQDGTVRIWDVSEHKLLSTIQTGGGWASCLAYSPDGTQLAVGSLDERVRLFDPATGKLLRTLDWKVEETNSVVQADVYGLAWSPDGSTLAVGGEDRAVRLWDVAEGRLTTTLRGHLGAVNAVAFLPAGDRLVSTSDDGTLLIWQTGAPPK